MSSPHPNGGFPSGFRESLRFRSPFWAATSAVHGDGDGDGDGGSINSLQHPQDGCSYTKLVRSRCFIDNNSDGKPVKKCEKTEQLLRNCVGRPQEIVESKSEYTEEDVATGWTLDSSVEEESGMLPGFQGVPSYPWWPSQGMDPFTKGLSDGIESFMQAAEEMMNDAFNQLGYYRQCDKGSDGHNFDGMGRKVPDGRHGRHLGEGPSPPEKTKPPTRKVDFTETRSFDEV